MMAVVVVGTEQEGFCYLLSKGGCRWVCFRELWWQSDSSSGPEARTPLRRLLQCSRSGNIGLHQVSRVEREKVVYC